MLEKHNISTIEDVDGKETDKISLQVTFDGLSEPELKKLEKRCEYSSSGTYLHELTQYSGPKDRPPLNIGPVWPVHPSTSSTDPILPMLAWLVYKGTSSSATHNTRHAFRFS